MLCAVSFLLSGCFFFSSNIEKIEFKNDEIELYVGDSLTIDDAYVTVSPSTVADKSFTVSSSNKEVVSVGANNKITGVGEGTAKITAKTNKGSLTAECTVKVFASEPAEMNIEASGKLFQRAGDVSAVDFSAVFDTVSPGKSVKWNMFLGDSVITHLNAPQKTSFSFTPQIAYSESPDGGVGLYTVKAETTGRQNKKLADEIVVGVYKDYIRQPSLNHVSGKLIQEEGEYGSAVFDVSYEDPQENPDRIICWLVNGEAAGSGKTFSFTPSSAGVYFVSAIVNGEKIDGEYSVTAKGSIVPSNLRLDFDNCFPEVVLSWDCAYSNLDYEVEIRGSNGAVITADKISTRNGGTASLFASDKLSVNLGVYVGRDTVNSVLTNSLSFRVRSLGDGKDFNESEYSDSLSVSAVGEAALEYLRKKYYDGAKNFYVSDEDEFIDLFAYLFLWRNNPVLSQKEESLSAQIYMAYTPDSMSELIEYAFDTLHFTGRNSFEYKLSGNKLSLTIKFLTDGLPSKEYRHDSTSLGANRGGSNAVRPHFDFSGSVRDKLPIENRAQSVTVTSSEQLYYIAQLGYKPIFGGYNSKAKQIYDAAAFVLKRIISDDMTDVEKAHAIYDFVMLYVNYDHGVTTVSTLEESVKYNAYYLEGVFLSEKPYAVCDGISKAYALMCNMENIECMRIAGMAGSEYDENSWGGHAWNKVKIDGEWYVVDCTWGDESMPLWDTSNFYHEFGFHRYFLLTDREIESTHGEDQPNKYPRTSLTPYNIYDDEIEYGDGKTVDLYINTSASAVAAEAEEIASYFDYLIKNDDMYKKQYVPYENMFLSSDYVAFDIRINAALSSMFPFDDNPMRDALIKLGYKPDSFRLRVDEGSNGYYMFVIIKL